MTEPYRTPACPNCSAPHAEPTRVCELCHEPFVPTETAREACEPCLRKASRVVERAAGRKTPRFDRTRRFLVPALTFALAGVVAFSLLELGRALGELRAITTMPLAVEGWQNDHHHQKRKPRDRGHGKHKQKQKQKPTPAPPPAPREEQAAESRASDPELPEFPSLLASLRPEDHRPDVLLARAEKLREAGVDLLLVRTRLGRSAFDSLSDLHTRVHPVQKNGKTVGIRIARLADDALASLAGIQRGDVLVSINGYDTQSPDHALEGYAASHKRGAAIIELLRGGRRVVLYLSWPVPVQAR